MLGIVATLKVKAGSEAEFERLAGELAQTVASSEPNCLYFALFRGEGVGVYHFLERYADEEALAAHRATTYLKSIGGRIVGQLLREPPTVLHMTAVPSA